MTDWEGSEWIEVSGRTVAEATETGLEALNLASADLAEIVVLEEPQRGLLGFGGRGARVRLRARADKTIGLERLVRDILSAIGLEAGVRLSRSTPGYVNVDLSGSGLGVLIGRHGETLDALQYLLNLAATKMPGEAERVILDAGGYRVRRRAALERLAENVASSVRSSGEGVVLEPMTPQERKIIHLAISSEPGVRSESKGDDPFRRVVIYPAEAPAEAAPGGTAGDAGRSEDDEDSKG